MKQELDLHAADAAAVEVATVTNRALTSNVVTLTTAAAHGLVTGDSVVVAIGNAVFDGTFTVASTPLTTTFTYAKTNANVTTGATTGTVSKIPTYVRLDVPGGRRGQQITIQNNGPGIVWYDFTAPDILVELDDVGIKLAVNAAITITYSGELFLFTTANDTDFRYAVA